MKKSIIPVAAFIAGMAIVPSVFAVDQPDTADDANTYTQWDDLMGCLKGEKAGVSTASTCKLGSDMKGTRNATLEVGGSEGVNITLDLNGHSFEGSYAGGSFFTTGKGSFTITGDGDDMITSIVNVAGEGAFTLAEGVTLKGDQPVLVSTNDKAVNVTIDGTLENTGTGYTIATNGDAKKANVVINGAIKSEKGYGVKQYAGTVALNGANVEAATGLYIEGGKLAVNNSTIAGTGFGQNGAALQVHSTATEKNVESIRIDGSSLSSKDGYAIYVEGDSGHGKTDLGEFILNNVKLIAKDENTFVLAKEHSKENKPGFANYLVDGKNHDALALETIKGSYESPAEQGDDEPTTDAEGDKTENPNTADTIATYITIATVAMLGLGATAFVAKKSNR